MGLAIMFLLPGGRAEHYSYKAEAGDETESEAMELKPEVTTIG